MQGTQQLAAASQQLPAAAEQPAGRRAGVYLAGIMRRQTPQTLVRQSGLQPQMLLSDQACQDTLMQSWDLCRPGAAQPVADRLRGVREQRHVKQQRTVQQRVRSLL